jgi:hypothetical protein
VCFHTLLKHILRILSVTCNVGGYKPVAVRKIKVNICSCISSTYAEAGCSNFTIRDLDLELLFASLYVERKS